MVNLTPYTAQLTEIRRLRSELGLITDVTDEQLAWHMVGIGLQEELSLLRKLREEMPAAPNLPWFLSEQEA